MQEQLGVLHLTTFLRLGWDKVMDTNVKSVFFLTQKLAAISRDRLQARLILQEL